MILASRVCVCVNVSTKVQTDSFRLFHAYVVYATWKEEGLLFATLTEYTAACNPQLCHLFCYLPRVQLGLTPAFVTPNLKTRVRLASHPASGRSLGRRCCSLFFSFFPFLGFRNRRNFPRKLVTRTRVVGPLLRGREQVLGQLPFTLRFCVEFGLTAVSQATQWSFVKVPA